ncbi:MAG: hypothetical protein AAGI49_08855 [Bacteroidota bacterium]
MKRSRNLQLDLSDSERKKLRKNKIKKSEIIQFAPDELEDILDISNARAKELHALAAFQQIPSIGKKFEEDLMFLGYFRLE